MVLAMCQQQLASASYLVCQKLLILILNFQGKLMLTPQHSEEQIQVRLPRLSNKTLSLSTGSRGSLQDMLSAKSWLLVTPTLHIGFRAGNKRQIASIAKTMTCLCSIQICRKFNINIKTAYFKVTSWSTAINGTTANLQPRSWVSIQDLLYGLMLPSGNDAALVLAQNLGAVLYFDRTGNKQLIREIRSIDLTQDHESVKDYMSEFINYMNDKSKQLKMTKTRFANVHGLDHANNFSCCDDVFILCKQAMSVDLVVKIVATLRYKGTMKTFKDKKMSCKAIMWVNTNKLLQTNSNVVGIKTGITPKAGGCLATQFKIDQQNYGFVIVLGCSSTQSRFKDTETILNYISDLKPFC